MSNGSGSVWRVRCAALAAVMACLVCGCAKNESDRSGAGSGESRSVERRSSESAIIPRRVLFGNPERADLKVSPDGKYLSYLAPVEGVMNVWVAPAGDIAKAKAVTAEKERGVRQHFWAFTSEHVLYAQDKGGDENWNIHSADVTAATPSVKNLTPNRAVQARLLRGSNAHPEEILVGLNDRDPKFHDVHRINVRSGEDKLVLENPGTILDEPVRYFVSDEDLRVRFAFTTTRDGGAQVFRPRDESQEPDWDPVDRIEMQDAMTTEPVGFDETGRFVYGTDSRGRDTAALVVIDSNDGQTQVLAEDARADATGDVFVHPTEKHVQAAAFNYQRREWKVIDPDVRGDFEYLKTVVDGDFEVTSRTLDDRTWTVAYVVSDGPVRYYVYDRPAKKATFLFTNRPALEKLKLARMEPVTIKSRDGLNLVSYLTLPVNATREKGPMVLLVHGGPWSRDVWGLNSTHQWLANRGYVVLSVNYRGSTGFGKKFVNASNREWGGKMHDDLIDAVNWAVKQGYADKDKVAIMGGSYGGYATLVGVTMTPDVFACGVNIVGLSNLLTFLKTIPPYWESGRAMWYARMGDETTEEGRKLLAERSPLTHVDKIKKPLLIGHGANDPRVKQSESDQIVKTMQEKGLPVTYVLYPDEGHGFGRPENRLSFNAVAEQFLARHLGGRAEPVGKDFEGSTIEVKAGAEHVKGLEEALVRK